jgi:hypothetical protein
MRKRAWVVEVRGRPTADGIERLSLAVKLMVDRALEARRERSGAVEGGAQPAAASTAADAEERV